MFRKSRLRDAIAAVGSKPCRWHSDEPAPVGEHPQRQAGIAQGILRPSREARRRNRRAVRRWSGDRNSAVLKTRRKPLLGKKLEIPTQLLRLVSNWAHI